MNRRLNLAGSTHVGIVRENNEDSCFISKYSDKFNIAIIADGMGGYRGGEVASEMCVNIINQFIENKIDSTKTPVDIKDLIYESINVANSSIYEYAGENEFLFGMGTTVVLALFDSNIIYIGNVGDSRAYKIKGNKPIRVTRDHSLVQEYVEKGKITLEQARVHPQRNIITQAVGTQDDVLIDIYETTLDDDDILLMCSDGLYDNLGDDEIVKIVRDNIDLEDAVNKLISKANDAGGSDNISVIIAAFTQGRRLNG